jgi:hypothetical protein
MQVFPIEFDPNYLIYAGAIGVLFGLMSIVLFFYRRILWIIRILLKQKTTSPKLLASLRNLLLIVVFISTFGMLLFIGFGLRAYRSFTYEEPVAEIITKPLNWPEQESVTLAKFFSDQSQTTRYFFVKGDQWMIEGDILKWDSWLNFLGFHTRYRLTRLKSRYLNTEAALHKPHTIYSLVEQEDHPFWRHLYQYGQKLPFISTVYGNAVFQDCRKNKKYLIYVGPSGFIVRESDLS